ncbi:AraC family transcriptional regulator ligand-binding domain-containing protein [Thalassotalea psychrophila]|uniref:AraC family transcriptional regulator ligand-binding domain-containing protein n=1 Tax=Thalassotalea psychrophila TaxID=3065647 RepID=A0ABY9TXW1_9GAMM|nr:AraC family transcriptional regulator ligand-binding domain-containing protein [Colwelliaceae bacterium SQ149]
MLNKNFTTYHGNIISLFEILKSYDVDVEQLANELNIDISKLRSKNIRMQAEQFDQLITLALEKTDDVMFPINFANYVHPTTYHALGMSLLSSSTLRSFWLRLARFFSLMTTIKSVELHLDTKPACIEFKPLVVHPSTTIHFHSAVTVAVLIKLIRQMYQPNYSPVRVSLVGAVAPATKILYENYFGCEVTLNAQSTIIYVDSEELDLSLPAANTDLTRQLDLLVIKYLETIEKSSLATKVAELLITLLPSGEFDREKIAKNLHMSPRTFHDKLKKENTSYQQILDHTRQQLADKYLKEMDIPFSELTYLLGFADSSSFSRAFKRWHGVPPSQYEV